MAEDAEVDVADARVADVRVADVPEESRFVVTVDGQRAGWLDYSVHGRTLIAEHTEVDPAYGGRGIGSALTVALLDAVRERGLQLIPRCPFVKRYVERHAAYADLVAGDAAGGGSAAGGSAAGGDAEGGAGTAGDDGDAGSSGEVRP